MATRENIWQSRYYAIPRLYMTLTGIWPYHTFHIRCMAFVLTFTFSFSIIVPQTSHLLIGPTDLDDLFDGVPSILITVIFSFKLVCILINQKKIKICLNTIEEDWLSLNTDNEKAILQRYTEYGQYVTAFYAIFMQIVIIFYILKPILMIMEQDSLNMTKSSISGASKLPLHVEYGEKLDQYFYPIMIHCYLAVFAHLFVTTAVDTLYYTLVHHACGMFSIVGHAIENISKNSNANFNLNLNKEKDDNYFLALNCLRRHLHVIQFAELIESTYTNVFLISVTLNMIAGSICGIQVLMNLSNARDVAAPLSIYIAQFIHLFLQFWQAQVLLDCSVIPYDSICKGKWYHMSRRCRKLFLLIMNRTSIPCKITAGGIVTLSIENFAMVLKTSLSYFTVLRSFQ